jgi:hypothetical protein
MGRRRVRVRCASPVRVESAVALIVVMLVLAVVGLLLLAGLVAPVVWLLHRSSTSTNPGRHQPGTFAASVSRAST